MQIRRWIAKNKSWYSHDEKRKGSLNMKLRCKTDPILRPQGCKEYRLLLLHRSTFEWLYRRKPKATGKEQDNWWAVQKSETDFVFLEPPYWIRAVMRRLSDRDALDRIWADSGDEDVVYDSQSDSDEYCNESENSGEYVSAEEWKMCFGKGTGTTRKEQRGSRYHTTTSCDPGREFKACIEFIVYNI